MVKSGKKLKTTAGLFAAFILWTAAVRLVDVQAIGPQESAVGFARLNRFIHELTGVHFTLYTITDWLGLVPFFVCMGFGILGLVQWVRRKGLGKVDRSLWVLAGFYVVVAAAYLFFECVVINYRPVLIEGRLEASYPSSTTLLVLCVMPTAAMQLRERLNGALRRWAVGLTVAFTVFMVAARFISGVHWFTDIAGGALLSAALVTMYSALAGRRAA